jgi:acetylornithine deacetylase/succinyl-diaminopimelate desuccinylase-like protein
MKGGIAMILNAVLRAKAEKIQLPGDVILAIVCDEEMLGDYGAGFLVKTHPELFSGIRYALGEFGGFSFSINKRRFFPIQVAEKQICWLRVHLNGPGGHGSMPVRGGAMAQLARLLHRLDSHSLPLHITPPARLMLQTMASALGGLTGLVMGQLVNPLLSSSMLGLLGQRGRLFAPVLRNTISPTILGGSTNFNVIPKEVTVDLDGRLLPGFKPDDLIRELHTLAGDEAQFEVVRFEPGSSSVDMGRFDILADILKEADAEAVPCPLLITGVTDGRFFSRLGIQTYGFLPMSLPEDFNFMETVHGVNERIPVKALEFGTRAIYQSLQRFRG